MPIGYDPLSVGSLARALARYFRGGEDGQVWTKQADGGQEWEDAASPLPTTTKGDLVVHNGTTNVRQAVGTNTYVLTADSAQTTGIKWAAAAAPAGPMSMGEISFTGNSTGTTITTTDTWTKVGITTTLNVNDDFDSPSAGRLRYTGTDTKTFHCGVSVSFSGAASDTFSFILYKNGTVNGNNEYTAGTALTDGTLTRKMGAAGDVGSSALHVMVELATNDYIELAVQNETDADDPTIEDMNLFAVGSPSTSATVSNGDKGDITVTGAGDTWTIDNGAVTYAKMQATAAASRILGRGSGGAGTITELTAGNGVTIGASSIAAEAWPVGSIFLSVVSTNPNTLLGYGTWSAIAAGRVLVGLDSGDTDFDTVEETGGAKTKAISAHSGTAVADHASHTHTYTEVVNHTHTVNVGSANDTSTVTGSGNIFAGTTSSVTATTANPSGGVATGTTAGPSATLTHSVTQPGDHTALNVVQPYFVCYMWKRTA